MMALALGAILANDLLQPDPVLDRIADAALTSAKTMVPSLAPDQVGICFGQIDRTRKTVRIGHVLGKQSFYPASTVKLFYLAYGATLLESGRLKMSTELQRGFHDMIVDSTNDATGYILDAITGTTGGPELSPKDLKAWLDKRNAVNRWLNDKGFKDINVNQKTWNEGPYGRERQGYGPNFANRNSLTAESGLQMMAMIAFESLVPNSRNEWMKGLLARKIPADAKDADYQSRAFVGAALPSGALLWSKAGYTDSVRMDIAWFKLSNGQEWIYSIFTRGQSKELKLIPAIAAKLLELTQNEPSPGWKEVEP